MSELSGKKLVIHLGFSAFLLVNDVCLLVCFSTLDIQLPQCHKRMLFPILLEIHQFPLQQPAHNGMKHSNFTQAALFRSVGAIIVQKSLQVSIPTAATLDNSPTVSAAIEGTSHTKDKCPVTTSARVQIYDCLMRRMDTGINLAAPKHKRL